jgi:signal transduction histidine kinase
MVRAADRLKLPVWAPMAAYIALAAVTTVMLLTDGDAGPLPILILLATLLLAASRPLVEVVIAVVVSQAILWVLLVGDVEGFDLTDLLGTAIAFAAAAVFGWGLQTRRRRIEGFEVEQAEATRQAAADERLRIAQELHDVVAHSLGVIAVQAGVGLHVMDREPEEARQALEHISRMSRSSLTEIRWLLGRVRNDDGTPAYAPAPGLGDLRRLVDEVGRAGLAVDLQVDGKADDVPPGIGLAAYRITQEALTNAVRHADAGRAEVRVGLAPGVLTIDVVDDGRGGEPEAGGHGLVGMHERAAVYGGTVEAGPGPDGGWRVQARLPYGEVAS